MREFYTRSFWQQRKPGKQSEGSRKLDEDGRKLIRALTEWTKIINAGRMSDINKERTKRLERVFEILRVVVESLGKEYKKIERIMATSPGIDVVKERGSYVAAVDRVSGSSDCQ